jgi:hypothetical protein
MCFNKEGWWWIDGEAENTSIFIFVHAILWGYFLLGHMWVKWRRVEVAVISFLWNVCNFLW